MARVAQNAVRQNRSGEVRRFRGRDPTTGSLTVGWVLTIDGDAVRSNNGRVRIFAALQSSVNAARQLGLPSVLVILDEESDEAGR